MIKEKEEVAAKTEEGKENGVVEGDNSQNTSPDAKRDS